MPRLRRCWRAGDTAWSDSDRLGAVHDAAGLALFYGTVGEKPAIHLMQCFAVACLMSVMWLVIVYSLAFGDGGTSNA